jgi:subtilase family serine protease
MSLDESPTVSAEVILRSKTGRSITYSRLAITSENVNDFSPSKRTVEEATRRLQRMGFSVISSGVTLSLSGKASLFEKVFNVKLRLGTDEATGVAIVNPEGELKVPESLRHVVEKVVFPERPEFFTQ